ncbi:MAG: homoserine dehydrogenase [Bacillota bacterium]
MPQDTVNLGLLGMGTVGGGAASILARRGALLETKADVQLKIKRVLVRDLSRERAVQLPPEVYTTEPSAVLADPEIDLVVELIGGIEPARTYILEALRRGKYVVTANKDLMARHGAELLEQARHLNRNIFYEASVGGGIPLVRPLKHCLVANRIERIIGIINGTTNYILTRMAQDNIAFSEALAQAQALGFAEADPSSDLEGRDAAYKLAILAGLAFHSRIDLGDIYVQGIGGVTQEDICYARELGYAVKLLALGERHGTADGNNLALRVQPTLVPLDHPLAAVLNEFNAVFIEGDAVGEVMFYGRGAGAAPTASAVMADVIDAVRCLRFQMENGVMESKFEPAAVLPVDALISRFYLRLLARDRPGVFAALATAFGDEQVSLDMIIQKRSEGGIAEIVLVTHHVLEERFKRALDRVASLPAIQPHYSVFRVLD